MRQPGVILAVSCIALWSGCGNEKVSDPPAELTISEPNEGALITTERVRVTGTATGIDRIDVLGVNAEVVGGTWEALVPVQQGEVELVATGDGVTDSVHVVVDSIPPKLEVQTPQRALYMALADGETVRVSGTVEDTGTGLEIVKINEQIVTPAVSGAWQHDVALRPGVNEITVVARDVAGNEVSDIRGVMYGDTVPADQLIDPAFNIWVDQQSGPVLEEVIEGFITPNNVTVLVDRYVQTDSVDLTSIAFDPVDVVLGLRPGAIELRLQASNVSIQGTFTIGGDPQPATIDIAKFAISVDLTPIVLADGGLDVDFSNPVLELDRNDLSYDIAGLSDEDSEFLEDQVVDIAQLGFGYVLTRGVVDSLFDPDILKRKVEIFGREITFDLRLADIDVLSDGVLVKTTVSMPAERWPTVRSDSPGALNRQPGPGTAQQNVEDINFTVTRNALDRMLHGVWWGGLLHYELEGSDFAGVTLPFELNAGALGAAFDAAITSVAPASTPAGIHLRPMFPPVVEYDVENKRLLLQLAEFHLDLVLLPAGREPIVVATVAAFLDLSVKLSAEGVLIKAAFETELRADLAAEPATDLDDDRAEELLESLVELIPTLVAQELVLQGEEDISWVSFEPPRVEAHGVDNDYATVSMGLIARPEELMPQPPPEDGN